VPDREAGEIGLERIRRVDDHRAAEIASFLEGGLGRAPRGGEHDDVGPCDCALY